jgi:hypothetical protein
MRVENAARGYCLHADDMQRRFSRQHWLHRNYSDVLAARHALCTRARTSNPLRWSGTTRDSTPRGAVTLNPESAAVIDAAIITLDIQANIA